MVDEELNTSDDSAGDQDRFLSLVLRYFDDDLPVSAAAELNCELRTNALSRLRFIEYCTQICLLRETFCSPYQAGLTSATGASSGSPHVSGGKLWDVDTLSLRSRLQKMVRRVSSWRMTAAALLAVAAAAVLLVCWPRDADPAATGIADLNEAIGDVSVVTAAGQTKDAREGLTINTGDTIRTKGTESAVGVAYPDGTRLTLVGNTSVTWGDPRSIVVHRGTLAASVNPRPVENALLLTTPSAQLQVLGTEFQIEAQLDRTDLSVTEGRVRLVRLHDQAAVEVTDGKYATLTGPSKLFVGDIPSLPTVWAEDFETGLPTAWDHGEFVTQDLPPGSRGAVKATFAAEEEGKAIYNIRSHTAWMQGLFAVQSGSHLHLTFKTQTRDWINVFLVTRTAGTHARFSGNYLLGDFPKTGSGRWETVTIPLSDFARIHAGHESLSEVVPFMLMFVFQGSDRGLVIDRVWVTPDGPGQVGSELLPIRPQGP